jgi:hypothetical protein
MKIIIYFFIASIFVINSNAQEIGISPTKIWTDNKEIENPLGFSIYFFQPIGKFGVKFEYVSAKNSRSYYGFLNGGFLLRPEDYIQDSISSNSTFRAIEFSLHLPKLLELFQNNLNIGAGITFDKFTREKVGLNSGKKFETNENKFGIFYSVSISRQNIFELPIKLEILFKHKALASGSFATDTEQPFVDAMDVKELQFNFAYVF